MAVKIVRQQNRIALLGAPVSAAALAPGGEGAPAAFRKAGLVSKLQSIGYDVVDMGDDRAQLYQSDQQSPRARNLPRVLAAIESLRPRVEIAVKSGALPLILGGDCSIALGTVAGLRRYFRHISVVYADADADLQTPATTPSGCVDGMVVSHLVGRGASELVRFWSDPPLVREPDMTLFGVSRLDPAEEQSLQTSPLRRYLVEDVRRKSPAKAASEAVERLHVGAREFVLHIDVDVIGDFQATNMPGSDGLRLEEVREALAVFATHAHLAAIEISGYNPTRDADGAGAQLLVEVLAEALATRKEKLKAAPAVAEPAAQPAPAEAVVLDSPATMAPAAAPGEAWSSDTLDELESNVDVESLENSSAAGFEESEEPHS